QEAPGWSGRSAVEPVIRVSIETFVTVKPKGRTVVFIGPALDGTDHDGPARAAVFGWSYARINFEFLRGIDVGKEQNRVHQTVVVVHAVQDVVVRLGAKAIDRECGVAALVIAYGFGHVAAAAAAGCVAIGATGDAGGQQSKLGEVAAIQR